jgi:hypothetical protein
MVQKDQNNTHNKSITIMNSTINLTIFLIKAIKGANTPFESKPALEAIILN